MSIVSSEKSVISSCEELAFPWLRHPDISRKLDRRARETGVRVLGTGVTPGFIMDFLPLVIATACQQVRSIRVERVVDVGSRRMQLHRRRGLSVRVSRGANDGTIGHVGLRESLFMIADSMGCRLDDVQETLEPVVAKARCKTEFFSVERGYVRGLRQSAHGLSAGREVVRLELEMSIGAKEPRDVITIDGKPPIQIWVAGSLQGDQATAAIMANCIPAIVHSRAVGLLSMRDMPLIPYLRPRPQPREEIE
jgi:4-hydroxy-tetrahydrodipicolinate reductase